MSAYICGEKTHKTLAIFAAQRSNGSRNRVNPEYLRRVKAYPNADHAEEVASFYADLLYQENIRSVQHRYPQDAVDQLPGPIVKEPALTVSLSDVCNAKTDPVTVLKLCDCLEYQSCETDDWEETGAFELLERIRKAAIRSLPGYDDAPWGLD
jgi:hypothetical protein